MKPTPAGVPVAITSPGFSIDHELKYEIKNGMSKIRSPVDALCMISPFSLPVSVSAAGSEISSAVTSHGPNAPL